MNIRLIDAGQVSHLRSQTMYHALAYAKQPDSPDTILLNTPMSPYVSLGFFRDLEREIDTAYCQAQMIPVIRRETGGGTVYIDSNQLFVQWIFGKRKLPAKTDERFRVFVEPLIETYRALGIMARYHPPGDVHVKNRKIVGTGAATIGHAELVTGNVLFDFDYDRMAHILSVPDTPFRELLRESLERYMTTLRRELKEVPDRGEIGKIYIEKCAYLLNRKLVPGDFTDDEFRMMEELDKRFSSEDWLGLDQIKPSAGQGRIVKIHAGVWLYELEHRAGDRVIRMHVRTRENRIDRVRIDRMTAFDPESRLEGLEKVLHNVQVSEVPLTEVLESFYEMHQLKSPGVEVRDWVDTLMQIQIRKP